jgi:NAD(P)-dependent dehydrogenase (short-subunit alcohol dehydrogenase family)
MSEDVFKQLFDLEGKTALVTGGAGGIGRAIALILARAGADVGVADLDAEGAKKVAGEIEGIGPKAYAIEADASKKADIEKMVNAVSDELGGIDVLVNNAGVFPPKMSFFDLEEEDWDRVYQLNTKGLFLCTKLVAEKMVEQERGGKIINLASIEGERTLASGMAHYEVSKASVVMFTKSMAVFLARYKINVNAVAPGVIDTKGMRAVMDSFDSNPEDAFLKRIPLRRLGTPEDVARGVLFFASKASDYVTGQCLFIDGGFIIA